MFYRYFIQLAYKGTHYHGWQVQENANSVQAEINKALSILLPGNIETLGCGRTDTGVHASDFYAHFDLSEKILKNDELVYKLNRILPLDIAIVRIFEVPNTAHARFDATARTYRYRISRKKNPFALESSYYLYGFLNITKMQEGAGLLKQYQDFSCFSKSNTQVNNNLCRIMECTWTEEKNMLIFTITANRFLRNMVRAIVGTLLELGTEKIDLTEFKNIIENKNRSGAGFSVPPEGLSLVRVDYPEKIFQL